MILLVSYWRGMYYYSSTEDCVFVLPPRSFPVAAFPVMLLSYVVCAALCLLGHKYGIVLWLVTDLLVVTIYAALLGLRENKIQQMCVDARKIRIDSAEPLELHEVFVAWREGMAHQYSGTRFMACGNLGVLIAYLAYSIIRRESTAEYLIVFISGIELCLFMLRVAQSRKRRKFLARLNDILDKLQISEE